MSKISDLLVSLVIPLPYEYSDDAIHYIEKAQGVLQECYANYEILLVDSSRPSKDDPIAPFLLELPNLRYYRISQGSSLEICMTAGLENAIGDVIITLTPGEDPVDLIPSFVERVALDGSIAIGVSTSKCKYPFLYGVGRSIYYKLLEHFVPERHPSNSTYFIGLSRQAVNSLLSIKYKSRLLRVFTSSLGFPTEYIFYEKKGSMHRPENSLQDSISNAIDSIIMNTTKPLRYAAYVGLFAAFFNLAYIGYIFLVNVFKDEVAEGWTTNSFQNSIMFFFMFIILTVLSEYIDRLFNETKDRPLYFIFEERNSAIRLNTEQFVNVVRES